MFNFLPIRSKLLVAYMSLVGVSIIWGTTYLAIRIGVHDFPPFLFVAIRKMIAGSLLLSYLKIVGLFSLPSWRELVIQSVYGFLFITLGNGLISWAEVYVPSGLTAIICSTLPIMIIVLSILVAHVERPSYHVVLGIVMGFAGVVLIFNDQLVELASRDYMLGIILIFTGTFSWAIGSVASKVKSRPGHPILKAAIQMFFGGFYCLLLSLFFDDWSNVSMTYNTFMALSYLIVFGSVAAFSMYIYALTHLPAVIVSMYSYVNPLVAVVLGYIILDEPFNKQLGIAFLCILVGVYLVNRGYRIKRS